MKPFAFALAALSALGCAPRYAPMAAHTLAAGENNDHDIVWITEDNERVLRCQNSKAGPVCTTAQIQ